MPERSKNVTNFSRSNIPRCKMEANEKVYCKS